MVVFEHVGRYVQPCDAGRNWKERLLAQITPFHRGLRRGVFPAVFHRNTLWSVIVRNRYEVTSYVRDGPVTRHLSCKRFVPASVFTERASSA